MRPEDKTLIEEKNAQLTELLPHMDADCWIVYSREGNDPSTLLFAGTQVHGEGVFVFTKDGQRCAFVADYDSFPIKQSGVFDEVVAYSSSYDSELRALYRRLAPERVALNFHPRDSLIDGLSHGLYLRLKKMLGDDRFDHKVTPASSILDPLRARKTPEEQRRLRHAVELTETILDEVGAHLKVGMSELELAEFIKTRQRHYGVTHSFGDGANVMTGRVGIGHRDAGEYPLTAGDTLIVDMGIYYRGYTSDIQRTFYALGPGEKNPPNAVQKRFEVGRDAVELAVAAMKPGVMAFEIDRVAREHQARHGVTPYSHALGHQIGRSVHDGGTTLAPLNPRYGDRGNAPLVVGEVYTVEPVVHGQTDMSGHPIGVEQDVVITPTGAEFLSSRQQTLVCVR